MICAVCYNQNMIIEHSVIAEIILLQEVQDVTKKATVQMTSTTIRAERPPASLFSEGQASRQSESVKGTVHFVSH